MRLVTFEYADQTCPGLMLGDRVVALNVAAAQCNETLDTSSLLAILRAGETALLALKRIAAQADKLRSLARPLSEVRLLAPIPCPQRNVFCVGRNYVDHVKEGASALKTDIKLPTVPQFFTKATHAVNSPEGDIRVARQITAQLDYEVELVLVIGRSGRDIPRERAFEHVFGYCVGNDVTARDIQRLHEQWFRGKSLDTTFPFGPAIVTRDEVADVTQLQLSLTVNGELRQQGRVAQMIFDIPAQIAALSAGLTLEAGDLIATGTPSGVGYAMKPPQFLRDGDIVEASISGLGTLRNRVVT